VGEELPEKELTCTEEYTALYILMPGGGRVWFVVIVLAVDGGEGGR
jgi:hypothetical protein